MRRHVLFLIFMNISETGFHYRCPAYNGFMQMIELQIEIVLLIAIGYILRKTGMLSLSTRKQLTSIVLSVVLPASIIASFQIGMTAEIFRSCWYVLLISLLVQLAASILNRFVWKGKGTKAQKTCLKYGLIASNAGFMGMPIAQAVYGEVGLLYASIFLIPMRVAMWSSGLSMFAPGVTPKETAKKVLSHPCIIAIEIGIMLMILEFFGFQLPSVLNRTLSAVASCNTALSMFVIGAILADVPFKALFDKLALYYSSLRLILMPLLVLAALHFTGLNLTVQGVCVLETAMPAASTTVMLAQNYNGDTEFASRLVFVSTVFSLITLPLFTWILTL